jgi:flagellar hook-length control protein FliK
VREATLTLVPLHLGRLQMKLSLSEGKVAAVVRAESKETLKLLEQHLPELRAALAEQGFAVESFELELGSSADHRREGRGDAGPRAALSPARLDESAISGRLAHLLQRLSPSAGGVDTYA